MMNETDLTRADLNLLVLFETVMRERHVGRTAQRLNLSPSAVSHGLSRLRALLADPLFIKTPRGVTPTDRALALEAPVAEILARVRAVVATSAPFDPRTSARAFTIGAPDGTAAVFLPPLVKALRREAPHVDIRIRQLMPRPGETSIEAAWRDAFTDLDARAMDLAVMPVATAPLRFAMRTLFEEGFVIAARSGHPWLAKPTLSAFVVAEHLVVSHTGDANGFVDIALAERGLARRVALTAPNFMLALALLADSDLLAAVPRSLFELHGRRFKLGCAKAPLALPRFALNAFAPKPALEDAGLSWLVALLARRRFVNSDAA
ncbi:MAG TPA: LysR family transcriptional regulator [Vitreimonas sp.]|uniref:LysR family transcriptional regulator n=1 Tax=Vitreimonas sp. TaxID=3069702 RepID=UPI002D444D53|nr:LysR family transcriptional regulator [Vitreimonas sp.]HYD86304.1 LysR family transcriptional regulator [Vitreimonas sp.]